MAKALKAYRGCQIGDEATPGSAVAATIVWDVIVNAPYHSKKWHYPENDRGILSTLHDNQAIVQDYVEGTIEGDLRTVLIPYLLSMVMVGNITPVHGDATAKPNAYQWTFQPSMTAGNTPDITAGVDTMTLEYGDNIQWMEVEYMFCKNLILTGAPGEPVKFSLEFGGRQVSTTTKTAALSNIASQVYPSNLCKFFIDTSYAAIGSAQKTGTLMGWEMTIPSGMTAQYGADGALYFTNLNEAARSIELKLTYYRDSVSQTAKGLFLAGTKTYIRLAMFGATEMDSAQTNYPYIYIDMAGLYTDWEDPGDEEGTVTETCTLTSVYDSTGARDYEAAIDTDLAAYPA